MKNVLPTALAMCVCLCVVDTVELDPYEYVYFNRVFAGGLKEASKNYETDYWGKTLKEGLDWVMEHDVPARAPASLYSPVKIASCSHPSQTSYFLEKNERLKRIYTPVFRENHPDILLTTTRYNCHQRPGKVLHVIERQDTPLLYIFDVSEVR